MPRFNLNALHYRCIDMDYGGTYTHRHEQVANKILKPDTFPAIGTRGCHTCVGVYMKLSPTTCFVAHINASHHLLDYSQTAQDIILHDQRVVTHAEGGYVRDQVINLLDEESARMHWPAAEEILNVVLVCPVLLHPVSGVILSGHYVVQAIREFLRRWDVPVDTTSEGFVVTHDTGEVHYFSWSVDVESRPSTDEDEGFVPHAFHGDERGEWFIDIGRLWQTGRGGKARAASVELTRPVEAAERRQSV